jgi:hypothetical protein
MISMIIVFSLLFVIIAYFTRIFLTYDSFLTGSVKIAIRFLRFLHACLIMHIVCVDNFVVNFSTEIIQFLYFLCNTCEWCIS